MLRRAALVRTDVPENVTADVIPSSPTLVTLMTEATRSFETLLVTRATWLHIPENVILQNHRLEKLKTGWTL
jgi:hypothetical protein